MPNNPDLFRTSSYAFDLPESQIAQTPIKNRDFSRLLVLDKTTGEISHKYFYDIAEYINPGDALVINETKVIPARLYGKNPTHAGEVETLLLERSGEESLGETSSAAWNCLVKPGKKAKKGDTLIYGGGLTGRVISVNADGTRDICFNFKGSFFEVLDKIGQTPLPPYIKEKLADSNRYQTVYATREGSAAAPTAGLHFTPELLEKIVGKGVSIIKTCLHVGLGTFRPVKEQNILDHKMHKEKISLSPDAAFEINRVKKAGGRIFAVGTTSVRVLESCSLQTGEVFPFEGETGIFIYPSYKFKATDCLITNFHLPESTLIMLVAAFAGYDNVIKAYNTAVKEGYRFFSFGDACLIL